MPIRPSPITSFFPISLACTAALVLSGACAAQNSPTKSPLTLNEAVRLAVSKYPTVGVSEEQVRSAAAGVRQAQTAFLPRLDGVAQINRATRNNIFGMLLPTGVLPNISGPPLQENSLTSVWGSAVGLVVSWEPFDFGRRAAGVTVARARERRAERRLDLTRLELSTLTADSFLTLLAAEATERAALANVERTTTLKRVVDALVKAGLRPGVEAERARAEQAAAQGQFLQAGGAKEAARALLAPLVGREPSEIEVISGQLFDESVLALPAPSSAVELNPIASEQEAAIREAEASLNQLERSYAPRFSLQGASYARGTGAVPDGRTLGGVNGLGPNIHNWGVGFTTTFPLFELPSLRAQRDAAAAQVRAEEKRLTAVTTELTGQVNAARARLRAAIAVARTTPVQLDAAQSTARQALVRYRTGLSGVVEVADAQRLLAEAEINNALARLAVWRQRLSVAAAQGDLTPLLQQVAP